MDILGIFRKLGIFPLGDTGERCPFTDDINVEVDKRVFSCASRDDYISKGCVRRVSEMLEEEDKSNQSNDYEHDDPPSR